MITRIKQCFSSRKIWIRFLVSVCFFFALFFIVVVASYIILPEGVLKSKNPLANFDTSRNIAISTLQIFSYNLLSVLAIIFASLFSFSNRNDSFLSYGYLALGVQFTINAVVLGTWSFSATNLAAPDLHVRLLRTFDIFHRSGLWEMMGQLMIACALARISFIRTNGKSVEHRPFRDIRVSNIEIATILLGLLLMLIGAMIESHAIINQA